MFARLARASDINAILSLSREYVAEVSEQLPHVVFDEMVVRETVQKYLDTSNPTIFVAEGKNGVVGLLVATASGFYFMTGTCCTNDVFFVTAGQRGSRAAALLIEQFNAWAERLKAKLLIGGNANNLYTHRTAKFYSRFGFRNFGAVMLKVRGWSG